MRRCLTDCADRSDVEKSALRSRIYRKIGINCLAEHKGTSVEVWNPARGDRILTWLGLEPLPTDADPKLFDPMLEGHWTVPMALAWAMWRNPGGIRRHWNRYCQASMEWSGRHRDQRRRDYRQKYAPSILRLKADGVGRKDALLINFDDAETQLMAALRAGTLIADGRAPNQARAKIPAIEWTDLTIRSGRNHQIEDVYAAIGDVHRHYEDIRLARSDVMRLFEPIGLPTDGRANSTLDASPIEASSGRVAQQLAAQAVVTVARRTAAINALAAHFVSSPDASQITRADAERYLIKNNLGVGSHIFKAVWKAARKQAGQPEKSKAGRKSKSTN